MVAALLMRLAGPVISACECLLYQQRLRERERERDVQQRRARTRCAHRETRTRRRLVGEARVGRGRDVASLGRGIVPAGASLSSL